MIGGGDDSDTDGLQEAIWSQWLSFEHFVTNVFTSEKERRVMVLDETYPKIGQFRSVKCF